MGKAKTEVPQEFKFLEHTLPKDEHQRETLIRFWQQLHFDNSALVVLKGQLIVEEKLTAIVSKFVFHPELLDDARLSFVQKLSLARSMSLDQHKNGVWKVIANLNSLRNALAHSLEGARREKATKALIAEYARECDGLTEDERADETALMTGVVIFLLGFLDTFEQEVERFAQLVRRLDAAINKGGGNRPT